MVLVDVDIVQENNDGYAIRLGYSINGTGFTITSEYLDAYAGNSVQALTSQSRIISGTNNKTQKTDTRSYFLFKGITIPIGSTIDNASFNVSGSSSVGGDVRVYGRKTASPTTPTNTTGSTIFTKPVGTAFGTTTFPSGTVAPVSIDMKSTIQELVNTFDYNNDNMMLIVKANVNTLPTTPISTGVSNSATIKPFEFGILTTPNLTINYSDPPCNADLCERFATYAISKLPTSRDNFNYSTQTIADLAWVTTDTTKMRVDTANEKIEIDAFMDGSDDHVTFDLGTGISDRWTLRGRITFVSAPGFGTAGSGIYFGLSANKDDNSAVPQDNAYMGYLHASSLQQWGVEWGASTNLPTDYFSVPIVETLPIGVELYWELKREGNVLTGQIFNNSDFTDSRGKPIRTDFNGSVGFPKNLRFIKFFNRFVVSVTNRVTWEADDIEFWDEGQQGDITFQDNFTLKPTTFLDDFSGVDNWVDQGTRVQVNLTTDVIDFDGIKESIIHSTVFDLGAGNVNDTSWVLRFNFRAINNTTAITNDTTVSVELTDSDQTVGVLSAQDTISFEYNVQLGTDIPRLVERHSDGVAINPGTGIVFATSLPIGRFFVEMKRVSATAMIINTFSDPSYTQLTKTSGIITIPSGISGLRYIKVRSRDDVTSAGVLVGDVDDIEFYNGTSTLTDWTNTGGKVFIDTNNRVVDWDANRDTFNHAISHDLQKSIGVNADDDNWTLRFKWLANNLTNPTGSEPDILHITLSQSDDSVTSGTAQEHIQVAFQAESSPNLRKAFIEAGTGSLHSATDVPFTDDLWSAGTQVFVELKRTSVTSYEASLYSDPQYRNLIERITSTSVDATVNALRYIKIQNRTDTVTDGIFNGIIDDIEFYNGVSVPRTPIVEVREFDEPFVFDDQGDADTAWVSSDTALIRAVQTTQQLEFDWTNHNVSDRIYHDLGSAQSETDWTLRCKITFSDVGEVTINVYPIGLYDSNAQDSGVTQDFVNIFMSDVLHMRFGDGINLLGGTGISSNLTFPTVGVPVYWELKRIKGTTFKFTQYSDPDYTVVIDSATLTGVPSTVDGLQFIKCVNRNDFTPGQVTGVIDDVQFWNGKNAKEHKNIWRETS